ncbi:MAG: PilZ domain-containing protein [Nitrospiria bacterium]
MNTPETWDARSETRQTLDKIKQYREYLKIPEVTITQKTPEGSEVTEEIRIRDISIQGIGGYATSRYQKGDRLRVTLKLVLPENNVVEEALTAEVRWATLVDQGKRYAFGLRFSEVEKKNPVVYTYLKKLEEKFMLA